MTEGWWDEAYYVLFDDAEAHRMTGSYGVDHYLPGYTVVGLKGWDDFIVRDASGNLYSVPTVPVNSRHLQALGAALPDALERDARWEGKIKWWIQPLVFGGNPRDARNVAWLSLEQHVQAVRWWNDKYLTMAPGA